MATFEEMFKEHKPNRASWTTMQSHFDAILGERKPPKEEPKPEEETSLIDDAIELGKLGLTQGMMLPNFLGGLAAETAGNVLQGLGNLQRNSLAGQYAPEVADLLQSLGEGATGVAETMANTGTLVPRISYNPDPTEDTPSKFIDQMNSAYTGALGNVARFFHADKVADAYGNKANELHVKDEERPAPDFTLDYLLSGLPVDLGERAGSMAAIAPAMAALPESAVAGMLNPIARAMINRGMYGAAKVFSQLAPNAVRYGLTSAPLEGIMEGGMTRENLLAQGYSDEEATKESAITALKNIPLLLATNTLEGLAMFSPLAGAGKIATAGQIGGRSLLNTAQESYEEFAQEGIQNAAEGKPYSYNPFNGAENQYEAAKYTAGPAALMGLIGGGVGAYRGRNTTDEQRENQQNWNRGSQRDISNEDYKNIAQNVSDFKLEDDLRSWTDKISGGKMSDKVFNSILYHARKNGIPAKIALAQATAESNGDQNEISPVGAIGVMQLMPETAKGLGVDPYDQEQNIRGGMKYLKDMYDQFGDWNLALAAYNAGAGAVQKYGGIPNYSETQNYVAKINGFLDESPYYNDDVNNNIRSTGIHYLGSNGKGEGNTWQKQNDNVSLDGAQPDLLNAIDVLGKWFYDRTGKRLVVTAGTNGTHADGEHSHAAGWKVDVNDWDGESDGYLVTADGSKGSLTDEFIKFGQSIGLGMNWEGDHIDVALDGNQWADENGNALDTPQNFGGFNPRKTANNQSSIQPSQQQQQPTTPKPLFDINREDDQAQDIFAQFAEEKYLNGLEKNNNDEVDFFSGMFDTDGKFQSTKENRDAIRQNFTDEFTAFAQNAMPKEQPTAQPKQAQSQQIQQTQPENPLLVNDNLRDVMINYLDSIDRNAPENSGFALEIEKAFNDGKQEKVKSMLESRGVSTTSQADPVTQNKPPENILSTPKKLSGQEKMIRDASAPVIEGKKGNKKRKTQGKALVNLAIQNKVEIPAAEVIALQNGSTKAVQKWHDELSKRGLFNTAQPQVQAQQVEPQRQDNSAAILKAREAYDNRKNKAMAVARNLMNMSETDESFVKHKSPNQSRTQSEPWEDLSEWSREHDITGTAYEKELQQRQAEEERQRQWKAKQDRELEELKARQAENKRLAEVRRKMDEEKVARQAVEEKQQQIENIQSILGNQDTELQRQITFALSEPSTNKQNRERQGNALLDLLERPQIKYAISDNGIVNSLKPSLKVGGKPAILKAQEILNELEAPEQRENRPVGKIRQTKSPIQLEQERRQREQKKQQRQWELAQRQEEESQRLQKTIEQDEFEDELQFESEMQETKMSHSEGLEDLFDNQEKPAPQVQEQPLTQEEIDKRLSQLGQISQEEADEYLNDITKQIQPQSEKIKKPSEIQSSKSQNTALFKRNDKDFPDIPAGRKAIKNAPDGTKIRGKWIGFGVNDEGQYIISNGKLQRLDENGYYDGKAVKLSPENIRKHFGQSSVVELELTYPENKSSTEESQPANQTEPKKMAKGNWHTIIGNANSREDLQSFIREKFSGAPLTIQEDGSVVHEETGEILSGIVRNNKGRWQYGKYEDNVEAEPKAESEQETEPKVQDNSRKEYDKQLDDESERNAKIEKVLGDAKEEAYKILEADKYPAVKSFLDRNVQNTIRNHKIDTVGKAEELAKRIIPTVKKFKDEGQFANGVLWELWRNKYGDPSRVERKNKAKFETVDKIIKQVEDGKLPLEKAYEDVKNFLETGRRKSKKTTSEPLAENKAESESEQIVTEKDEDTNKEKVSENVLSEEEIKEISSKGIEYLRIDERLRATLHKKFPKIKAAIDAIIGLNNSIKGTRGIYDRNSSPRAIAHDLLTENEKIRDFLLLFATQKMYDAWWLEKSVKNNKSAKTEQTKDDVQELFKAYKEKELTQEEVYQKTGRLLFPDNKDFMTAEEQKQFDIKQKKNAEARAKKAAKESSALENLQKEIAEIVLPYPVLAENTERYIRDNIIYVRMSFDKQLAELQRQLAYLKNEHDNNKLLLREFEATAKKLKRQFGNNNHKKWGTGFVDDVAEDVKDGKTTPEQGLRQLKEQFPAYEIPYLEKLRSEKQLPRTGAKSEEGKPKHSQQGKDVDTTIRNYVDQKDLTPQQQLLQDFGRKLGTRVIFFNNGDGRFHGQHSNGITYLNVVSNMPLGKVFWHESMHWLKANNPKLYQQLVKAVGITDEQRQAYLERTERNDLKNDEAIDEEIISDQFEDVAKRSGLLQSISGKNRGLIQRVIQWLQDTMKKFIEHFRNPQGKFTTAQSQALADEFGKIAKDLVDPNGEQIFRYNRRTHNVELANGRDWNSIEQGKFDSVGTISFSTTGNLIATDEEYMQAVEEFQSAKTESDKQQALEALQSMVQKAAEVSGFHNAVPEQTVAYKVRTTAAPKKAIKVYKVFTVASDGSPTALFVGGTEKLPQGVWLDAQDAYHFKAKNGLYYVPSTQNPFTKGGKTGGSVEIPNESIREELIKRGFLPKGSKATKITALAYRPGWHAGTLPFFPQGGMKPPKGMKSAYENIHRYNQVVFECELAAEKNYTAEAEAQPKARNKDGSLNSRKADLQRMPENGFYYYATNPMTHGHPEMGMWAISGSLKINRALTQEECDKILADNGKLPQEWEQGKLNLADLGYTGEQNDAARKTLAPITYDDNGNIIPLSQRFDATKNDIRYSIDASDNSNESTLQRIRNKVSAFFNPPPKSRNKRIKQFLEKLADIRIVAGHIKGAKLINVDEFHRLLHTRKAYDWGNILPEIGGMLAKSLNIQDSEAMRNYVTDWLLTGAPNNNSAEAMTFQQAARNNPAMFEILQKIRDEFDEFNNLSGMEQYEEGIVDNDKTLGEKLGYYKDNWREEFTDDLHPIERMFNQVVAKAEKTNPKLAEWLKESVNPYELARLVRGKGAVADILIGKVGSSPSKKINEIRATLAEAYPNVNFSNFKPITMILEEIGALEDKKKQRQFESFCVAKLDKEMYEKMRSDPKTYKNITPFRSEAKADEVIAQYEKEFGQAQRDLVHYSNVLITMRYDAGLMSKSKYDDILSGWKNYIPTARVFEENEDYDFIDSLKQKTGSHRDIRTPIQKLIDNTNSLVKQAERNKVKCQVAQLARCGQFGQIIAVTENSKPNLDNTVLFYEHGKKCWLETPDLSVVRALNSIQSQKDGAWIVKAFNAAMSFFRSMLTNRNLDFAAGNTFRDSAAAYIHNKHLGYANPFMFFADVARIGLKGFWTKDSNWLEWQMFGGSQASFVSEDVDYVQRSISDITETGWESFKKHPLSWVLDKMQYVAEASETATRLTTYVRTRDALAKQRADGKATIDDKRRAALTSRNATIDFSRAGTSTRKANRVFAFANAAVQDWALQAQTFSPAQIQKAINGNKQAQQQIFSAAFRLILMGIVPTLLQFALMHRDDDKKKIYSDLHDWEKETYWYFGDLVHIPKSMDIGIRLTSAITDEFLKTAIDKEPAEWKRFRRLILDAAPGLTATLATPAVEAWVNYSIFRDAPIVPGKEQHLPGNLQYGHDTSPAAKFISDNTLTIAKIFGAETGFSPRKIDYMISGYLGFMGRFFSHLPNYVGRGSISRDELPIVRRFLYEPYKNPKIVKDYYEALDEQSNLYNGYKLELQKDRKTKPPEDFDPKLYGRLKSAQKTMQNLSKREKQIEEDPKLSESQRKEKLRELELRRIEICERVFNKAR